MSKFIVTCIYCGVLIIISLISWIVYFASKRNQTFCICTGTSFMVAAAIIAIIFAGTYHHCPNCDYLTDAAYCQECGSEVNPTINCPACMKDFNTNDTNKVPTFCPDCGTRVKE